jgi:hypothetical protein
MLPHRPQSMTPDLPEDMTMMRLMGIWEMTPASLKTVSRLK